MSVVEAQAKYYENTKKKVINFSQGNLGSRRGDNWTGIWKASRIATFGPKRKNLQGRVSKSSKTGKCKNVYTMSSPLQTSVDGRRGEEMSLERWTEDKLCNWVQCGLLPNSLQLENVKYDDKRYQSPGRCELWASRRTGSFDQGPSCQMPICRERGRGGAASLRRAVSGTGCNTCLPFPMGVSFWLLPTLSQTEGSTEKSSPGALPVGLVLLCAR